MSPDRICYLSEEAQQRFARELDGNKKFAFAFAKRFAAQARLKMETLLLFVVISTIALSAGFAYDDERNTDLAKERFARDLAKQKFAFAFAKRNPDLSEEAQQRFARELDGNKKFAFAFAKRFADRDDQLVRFARPSFA
ncbi:hypothetical protein OSTOST_05959 [Ostertagia ostertagi]